MGGRGRQLVITADDFGIGPETTRGILDLAAAGVLTSTVLLVNSPFAEAGVEAWRAAGKPLELGWHPCLTLDRPVLTPDRVPSLVEPDGRFPGLGGFLKRIVRGSLRRGELEAELSAQLARFVSLVGHPPATVNGHHHVHIFPPVASALASVLAPLTPRPFVRRVCEPARTLLRVPGARAKRAVLAVVGARAARRQRAGGFPGADTLIGVTDPPFVHDPRFFARWLAHARGRVVELTCHPGHLDDTLGGRDGSAADGHLARRVGEWERLAAPEFLAAVAASGFAPVPAAAVPLC